MLTARVVALMTVALLALSGCGDGDGDGGTRVGGAVAGQVLTADSTWQWQLQGDINTGYDVDVYDIDLFDTDEALIADLRSTGHIVICYFSAGSYEEWRADADAFPIDGLGEPLDGWEGERWVDVRSAAVRAVLVSRLDLAVAKGCDGVEPDNVTAYNNNTGFDIAADDQLAFNRFLAEAAHDRSLLIGLKNDLEQIPDLVDEFDFAVNEECFQYDECDAYRPFLDEAKPVFNAEYGEDYLSDPSQLCSQARALGLRTLILSLDLDNSVRISCDS